MAITGLLKTDTCYVWDGIISDILDFSLEDGSCIFTHVRRTSNVLAHNLASLPCETGEHLIWRDSLPPGICNPDLTI